MSFDARDLTIKLSATSQGMEGLWAMACPGCDSTAAKPGCNPPSRPCPAPSKPPACPPPSKKADGVGRGEPSAIHLLRGQLRDALGLPG